MTIYLIAFAGALFAGCLNTLAGNGSAITLTILTELCGLPGNVANGTNRVGVLLNGLGASMGFYKEGKLDLKIGKPIIIAVSLGALLGVFLAVNVSNDQFMFVFKYLMIGMLFIILFNPKKWMIKTKKDSLVPKYLTFPLYFLIGFYGGFIQMGMGIFFLAVLVLISRLPIIEANAIKAVSVLLYSIIALAIFHYNGLVDWKIGAVMGVAQFTGSWVTARFASNYKGIEKIAYYMLLVAMGLAILKLFHIL